MSLPRADKPEDLGLSSQRIWRLTDALQRDVDKGAAPGAVLLIARHGKIACHEAIGLRDREAGAPMTTDTLFRIYSMTKPFTSVAAMMLSEEGALSLADPVATYLPEFASLKVAVDSDSTTSHNLATESLRRAMTVQDLLRHTSGLTYPQLAGPMLKPPYEAANIGDDQSNAEMVTRLAQVPLAYQPGSTWQYGYSTDVLGRVVEVASGMALDQFIETRITAPLGLQYTSFGPIDGARMAEPQVNAASGKRPPLRDVTKRHAWLSGGSGLVSTAGDYVRFCQMLLNGGELEGARLLSPATVALMTCDHLAPGIAYGPQMRAMFGALAPVPEHGIGFGLGFAVRNEPGLCALPGSVGDYSWSGVSGTYFWIDPRRELIAILMMQAPIERMRYRYLMRAMVYQALLN
ncbi:MAG TPA: serine hydrolase domain-containing protein [Pseudolabrys sp.]|nr:serine hydrolase domain-containing protein [Pseudolabrys sp.]